MRSIANASAERLTVENEIGWEKFTPHLTFTGYLSGFGQLLQLSVILRELIWQSFVEEGEAFDVRADELSLKTLIL